MPGYGALLPSRLCNFEHPFTIKTGHCGIQFRPLRGKPASTEKLLTTTRRRLICPLIRCPPSGGKNARPAKKIFMRYKGEPSKERYEFIRDYLDFKLKRMK
jgi:hypothetical protein